MALVALGVFKRGPPQKSKPTVPYAGCAGLLRQASFTTPAGKVNWRWGKPPSKERYSRCEQRQKPAPLLAWRVSPNPPSSSAFAAGRAGPFDKPDFRARFITEFAHVVVPVPVRHGHATVWARVSLVGSFSDDEPERASEPRWRNEATVDGGLIVVRSTFFPSFFCDR